MTDSSHPPDTGAWVNKQMEPHSESPASNESGSAAGFVVRPTADSHFAWIRTRLSADSTLMG
jgi:hypothetical protein